MSTISFYYYPSTIGEGLASFKLGRTPEEARQSNVFAVILSEGEQPSKTEATVTFCPGRQKDVLWAFQITADMYTNRTDRIDEAARALRSLFNCGITRDWKQLLTDWLVHPDEDNLR